MMKKTLVLAIVLLALLLAACGDPQTPEEKAYQFLSALLEDDAELQQAILDNLTVIGEGVPAPTEEELAAREEREAALTEMLHDRFDGLVSPVLFDKIAQSDSLTQWQTRLACTGAKAAINECSFTDKYSRMVFEGTVHCVNGEEETDLPLQGEVVFNEDGLIDSFSLYEDESGFTGWLRAQDTVSAAMQERIDAVTGQNEAAVVSDEELASINQWLEPLIEVGGYIAASPVSSFLTSYYDCPEDIDLARFLKCNSCGSLVQEDGAEFAALKAHPDWPFGSDIDFDAMPVPIHRFPAETVNELLLEYTGVGLADLNGIGAEDVIYLEGYDAYYNFTSDFATGTFVAGSGLRDGNYVRLLSDDGLVELCLKQEQDKWLIQSHRLATE